VSGDMSESSKNLQQDVWLALKARKESLETQLKQKLDKLKDLCIKEAVSSPIPLIVGIISSYSTVKRDKSADKHVNFKTRSTSHTALLPSALCAVGWVARRACL